MKRRILIAALTLFQILALTPALVAGERMLVIALDAIPFWLVEELTDPERGSAALFADLEGPAALVSTFPSSTSVAMPGILEPFGVGPSPGYEARFFDREEGRKRGAGPVSYYRIEFPWREFFWRRTSLWRKMLGAVRPVRASLAQIDHILGAFLASDDPVFFGYVGETDLVAHRDPAQLATVLRGLEERLERLRAEHPDRPFRIVIFSDHGIAGAEEPLENVWPRLRKVVESSRYRLRDRLRETHDVVFVPYGLVSSLEAYTQEGHEAQVAQVLTMVPGIDLCATRSESGFFVHSDEGTAFFSRRSSPEGELWAYQPLTGDPLAYLPEVLELRGCSGRPGGTWFPDRWWFETTRDATYPDAFRRLSEGFELVENPGSVICSLDPGFMFGARRTQLAARLSIGPLRWTHGALYREATLGFLMTDSPGWWPGEAVRSQPALGFAARGGEGAAAPGEGRIASRE